MPITKHKKTKLTYKTHENKINTKAVKNGVQILFCVWLDMVRIDSKEAQFWYFVYINEKNRK